MRETKKKPNENVRHLQLEAHLYVVETLKSMLKREKNQIDDSTEEEPTLSLSSQRCPKCMDTRYQIKNVVRMKKETSVRLLRKEEGACWIVHARRKTARRLLLAACGEKANISLVVNEFSGCC